MTDSSSILSAKELLAVSAGYLLGCVASAYYWVRWRSGQDIRRQGSGTVGARNAGRLLGRAAFTVVFLFDLIKGAAAVWLARHFQLGEGVVIAVMLAVLAGHIWPVQLRFHGGKGLSTLAGTMLVFDWHLVLAVVVVIGVICLFSRRITLNALLALAAAPALAFLLGRGGMEIAGVAALVGLVLWAHRGNLREEIAGVLAGRPLKEAGLHTEAKS